MINSTLLSCLHCLYIDPLSLFLPPPPFFLSFFLSFFLLISHLPRKASIDNTYLGILCEDFVEKLNTIALDSLVYLLGPRANLTADVKDNHLDVIRNLVFILARDTDRGTGIPCEYYIYCLINFVY